MVDHENILTWKLLAWIFLTRKFPELRWISEYYCTCFMDHSILLYMSYGSQYTTVHVIRISVYYCTCHMNLSILLYMSYMNFSILLYTCHVLWISTYYCTCTYPMNLSIPLYMTYNVSQYTTEHALWMSVYYCECPMDLSILLCMSLWISVYYCACPYGSQYTTVHVLKYRTSLEKNFYWCFSFRLEFCPQIVRPIKFSWRKIMTCTLQMHDMSEECVKFVVYGALMVIIPASLCWYTEFSNLCMKQLTFCRAGMSMRDSHAQWVGLDKSVNFRHAMADYNSSSLAVHC